MGANSEEVNIDLSFVYVPKTISDVLTEVSSMDDISKKLSKLNQYVIALEEEQRKIDAFKRELPLCMFLLKDAVERLKEEALLHKGKDESPVTVTEEFIPVKGKSDESGRVKKSNDISEKKNWMSSAQLWSTPVNYESIDFGKQGHFLHLKPSGEEVRKERGAFMPFKERSVGAVKEEKDNNGLPVEVLSLSMPVGERERVSNLIDLSLSRDNGRIGCDSPQDKALHHHLRQQQQQRKQRRCWSAELHRKFIDALHQLGGAQTATPKQIREIMQVDGLTNDEVKSHLQKYRLHVRRLPMPNYAWMSNDDEQVISSETNVTQSGSPEGPLHLGGSSAKGLSITDRESMEEDEDGDNKSESYTCNSKRIEANA